MSGIRKIVSLQEVAEILEVSQVEEVLEGGEFDAIFLHHPTLGSALIVNGNAEKHLLVQL